MKTKVTMREYDDDGRMVKETITETEDTYIYQHVYPQPIMISPQPVTPNWLPGTVWCSTSTTNALSNEGSYVSVGA